MAPRVTSSSNRNRRSSSRPVTRGQNPQRSNRQRLSNATVTQGSNGRGNGNRGSGGRVTNSGQRTNTGSARVTGASRAALPPGTRGGQVTPRASTAATSTRSNGGSVRQVSVRDLGPNRPNQIGGTSARASLPSSTRGGAAPRPSSTLRLPGGVRGPIGMGGLRGGLIGAIGGVAVDAIGRRAGEALGNFLRTEYEKPKEDRRTNLPGGRSNRSSQPQRPANQYENLYDPGGSRSNYGLDKPQPVAPLPASVRPSTSGGGSSGSNRSSSGSTGGGRRSSTPARPAAPAAPAKPGQKWDDFNPNRGTSKSNNPLLDRDKGGIKLRDRMKQREDKADKNAGPTKDGKEYGQYLERQRDRNDQAMGPMKDGQAYADYLMRRKKNA